MKGVEDSSTAAQAILRWHLQRGITPIPKASSRKRIAENADVFSFAVVLWELMFPAKQPYEGESTISVAMGVLNDGRRPHVPAPAECAAQGVPTRFLGLMASCWATDPTKRPTFATILDEMEVALR